MGTPAALTERPQPFEQQAVEVLGRIRSAIAALISAIPNTSIRRAADLQRATKIDVKLSWRLFRVARAATPLAAGPYIPGPANFRTFLKAVSSLGISDQVLAAVESAAADFERLVTDHAGDRSTFDSMISTMCRGDDADQSNLQQRRAAFRANRHVWGVQAGMQVKCVFTNYGEDPARVSVAVVDGYVALRQLRHGAPLIITSARAADDLGAPLKVRRRPIDTDAPSMHGLALLREFCSQPQPELKEVAAASGFVCGELTSQGLGIGGAITCFTGWQADNVASRYRAPGNLLAITHGAVRIPCESITICLLTRIGLFEGAQPQLAVYSDHMAELPYPVHLQRLDHLLLPDESVAYLGRGATALSTLEAPRMAELAQYVFDRVGWNGEEFEVHRCQIAYPILPSTVAISIDLPERRG